jgi:hypothetical protein
MAHYRDMHGLAHRAQPPHKPKQKAYAFKLKLEELTTRRIKQ